MNALTIIVLAVIGLFALGGYHQGFLRVVYSLLGWVLVLGFVTFITPYITEYIEENTKIQETIREKCITYLEESEDKEDKELNKTFLPKSVMGDFAQSAANGAEELLAGSGIYESIAETVSHFIVEGISFFAAFIVASVLMHSLAGILDIVSHLPVVKDVNKGLGAIAGGIKGLFVVWLAFYLLAICITNEFAGQIFTYVESSPILMFLYDNNLLLWLISIFLKS